MLDDILNKDVHLHICSDRGREKPREIKEKEVMWDKKQQQGEEVHLQEQRIRKHTKIREKTRLIETKNNE